jgi:hypothetical protein
MASPVADEMKRLTSDPGARKLGEYVDKLHERLITLEKQVADCCDLTAVPVVAVSPATPS